MNIYKKISTIMKKSSALPSLLIAIGPQLHSSLSTPGFPKPF